jgi:comEA protein
VCGGPARVAVGETVARAGFQPERVVRHGREAISISLLRTRHRRGTASRHTRTTVVLPIGQKEKLMTRKRLIAVSLAFVLAVLTSTGVAFAAAKPAPTGKINVNTATAQQFATLPGVGEKLATRIVDYRQKSGGFKSVQELMNVQGIGEKNFAKLQQYLTSSDTGARASAK